MPKTFLARSLALISVFGSLTTSKSFASIWAWLIPLSESSPNFWATVVSCSLVIVISSMTLLLLMLLIVSDQDYPGFGSYFGQLYTDQLQIFSRRIFAPY